MATDSPKTARVSKFLEFTDSDLESDNDICRVCRCEGSADNPLFHPCICTGSIKFIHQECLDQWLHYSKKEYCELCRHKFQFMPIYAPDMPKTLLLADVLHSLTQSVLRFLRFWIHYTLVAFAWLGVVPLTACRIYRSLFTGSVASFLTLPLAMLSTDNLINDCFTGALIAITSLMAFFGFLWLKEAVFVGGPQWLLEDLFHPDLVLQPPAALPVEGAPEAQVPAEADPQPPAENPEVPVEEAAEQVDAEGDAPGNINWNHPVNWERAADELNWERLLGFDGSLVFLEHVFMVIGLNTLFILVFAYCPYHVGFFILTSLGYKQETVMPLSYMDGLIKTLLGYVTVGALLGMGHTLLKLTFLHNIRVFFGIGYLVVKVILLMVSNFCLCPIICGVWLDVSSTTLLNSTLKERVTWFHSSPTSFLLIHWLAGFIWVIYTFAFVFIALREVLSPALFRFFYKNFQHADAHIFMEWLRLSYLEHIKDVIVSLTVFGFLSVVMLALPAKLLQFLFTDFLPYKVSMSFETTTDLSFEVYAFQIFLPVGIQLGHTQNWLIIFLKLSFSVYGRILGLRKFLLSRKAILPDFSVSYLKLKLFGLAVFLTLQVFFVSFVALSLPMFLGRWFISVLHLEPTHEIVTFSVGLYMCWLAARTVQLVYDWLSQDRSALTNRMKEWCLIIIKITLVGILFGIIVPLMIGLFVELVCLISLRLPSKSTAVLCSVDCWFIGFLFSKVFVVSIIIGPNWWMREALEGMYEEGFVRIRFDFIWRTLYFPIVSFLGTLLAGPYVLAHGIAPLLISDENLLSNFSKQIYLIVLIVICLVTFIRHEIDQFIRFYETIKNQRYLVGRILLNYNHNPEVPSY